MSQTKPKTNRKILNNEMYLLHWYRNIRYIKTAATFFGDNLPAVYKARTQHHARSTHSVLFVYRSRCFCSLAFLVILIFLHFTETLQFLYLYLLFFLLLFFFFVFCLLFVFWLFFCSFFSLFFYNKINLCMLLHTLLTQRGC